MKKYLIAATAAAFVAPAAHAASIDYSSSIALQSTDWVSQFELSQFDPSLGTLTGVQFRLEGFVDGTASAQNLSDFAVSPTLNLQAVITAAFAGTELAEVVPSGTEKVELEAFTGTLGFDGDDAVADRPLNGSASVTNSFSTGLASFIGTGTLFVDADAEATSGVTGGGNATLLQNFATDASANATITYTYDEAVVPIPLPATAFLMLAALGSLLAFRRYS